jgi:hypothetical protein
MSFEVTTFQVTMMLADSAQALDNKLYILGGGWSITGPEPSPSAIALQIKVPWTETNRQHRMRIELLDPDSQPVAFDSPVGRQPLILQSEFEVGRPAGMKPGSPIEIALAINIGPLPLEPDSRYEWRLHIDDDTREEWTLPFSTRSRPDVSPPPAAS